jgi:hypothetical protein
MNFQNGSIAMPLSHPWRIGCKKNPQQRAVLGKIVLMLNGNRPGASYCGFSTEMSVFDGAKRERSNGREL